MKKDNVVELIQPGEFKDHSNSRSKNVNGSNFEKVYAMKLSLRALSRDIWVKSG